MRVGIRKSRKWIVVEDRSNEKDNSSTELGMIVIFTLPDRDIDSGFEIENTRASAIWYYLNRIVRHSTISYRRV